MTTPDTTKTKKFWNRIAHDWDRQVGDSGDNNPQLVRTKTRPYSVAFRLKKPQA